ncbi:MAG: methyltransferase [Phenylobacterium sp.]|uniref:methyltransferase domain-containing protein n=1 Tax=Phenylobacterium sp. TaxID=1871053 RepID=UPI001A3BE64F|nr:methyltransferase [Phenylobacterium sp.]MBL8773253.1 methyltransferase [Phenylobacterium sp.]
MSVTAVVVNLVRERVAKWPADPGQGVVFDLLRLLSRWRSQMLANTYIHLQGRRIWSGPFVGMEYVDSATEGALMPRLLGTYESELHPHLASLAAEGLDGVIDVGCAEGYYAVGLARMMPDVTVYAYDIDEKARASCAELAQRNGVADRVVVGGEFKPDGFEAFAGRRMLVLVDTEGAELDILRPDLSPALAGMSIIVETHDVFRAGALETLQARFAATHDIVRVDQQPKTFEMPPFLRPMTHLDQLLAVWEWRLQPTPWLVMRPKRT